jgi:hypothetical protein
MSPADAMPVIARTVITIEKNFNKRITSP